MTNPAQFWSKDEVDTVLRLHGLGQTCRQIACAVPTRSVDTIRSMLNKSGRLSNPAKPDTAAIDADRAVIAKAFKSGMTDARIKQALLPHRSRSWIEQQRRGMGLKRVSVTGGKTTQTWDCSEEQTITRLRRSSVMLLAALKASHAAPGAEVALKRGTPRIIPTASSAFSGITSFGGLCAEVGHAD